MPKNIMTRDAASRIQSNTAKNNGGMVPKNSFASRAMSAAYKNEPIDSMPGARSGTSKSPNFFQPSDSDSDNNGLALALGVGALVGIAGLTMYSLTK